MLLSIPLIGLIFSCGLILVGNRPKHSVCSSASHLHTSSSTLETISLMYMQSTQFASVGHAAAHQLIFLQELGIMLLPSVRAHYQQHPNTQTRGVFNCTPKDPYNTSLQRMQAQKKTALIHKLLLSLLPMTVSNVCAYVTGQSAYKHSSHGIT